MGRPTFFGLSRIPHPYALFDMNMSRFQASRRPAFTLVELLVVIGIIAMLVSILLPAMSGARKAAQNVQCAGNIRQICTAMLGYASENRGRFPPNITTPASEKLWYGQDSIGRWLSLAKDTNNNFGGGVMICPADDGAWRSYAMNHWACSKVDVILFGPQPVRSVWSSSMPKSSQMILITEAWSSIGGVSGPYSATATVGKRGNNAGLLFGSKMGFQAGRWRTVYSELTYNRHRNGRGKGNEPVGRLNIGYADGHVATVSNDDLADASSGLSTLDSLWSEMDFQYP